MPEPAPEPTPQIILAARILRRIHLRTRLHLPRHRHQPGFARVGTLPVTAPAFVVIQVLAVGIVFVYAVNGVGLVHVPADKVDGVVKVLPAGAVASGAFLVVAPHFVLGLGVAGGRRHTTPGDDPQQVLAWCLGVLPEARFLIHDRERHLDRHAPARLGHLGGVVPIVFFAEDAADVVGGAGWRGAASRQ